MYYFKRRIIVKEEIEKFKKYHRDGEIAFAIEQLKKVDRFVSEMCNVFEYDFLIDRFEVLQYIDKLMKKLKGNNNG
jgi:hypothetical protein